jgi:hypothetical protein
MARIEETVRCDGCGVEILGSPLVVAGYYYCCQDCRDGLECECAQKAELDEERGEGPGATGTDY